MIIPGYNVPVITVKIVESLERPSHTPYNMIHIHDLYSLSRPAVVSDARFSCYACYKESMPWICKTGVLFMAVISRLKFLDLLSLNICLLTNTNSCLSTVQTF